MKSILTKVSYINFNQNGSCISIATNKGFNITKCDPFRKYFVEENGSFSIVEMLFSSSLIVVVGLGEDKSPSPRQLQIRNIETAEVICRLMFPTSILCVKLNHSRLVVALDKEIYIYNLSNMKLLHKIIDQHKLDGIVTISLTQSNLLAYPTHATRTKRRTSSKSATNTTMRSRRTSIQISRSMSPNGTLKNANDDNDGDNAVAAVISNRKRDGSEGAIEEDNDDISIIRNVNNGIDDLNGNEIIKKGDVTIFDMTTLRPLMVIDAHINPIKCLALSKDGSLLGTTSNLGTIIRVFDTTNGHKLYQFRRGTYRSNIHSLYFSEDNEFLAATSSSDTVHIFQLENHINKIRAIESNDSSINQFSSDNNDDDGTSNETDNFNNFVVVNQDFLPTGSKENKYSTEAMTKLLKKSSKKISKEATRRFNKIFSGKEKGKIITKRNFAWCKLPLDRNEDNYSVISIGSLTKIDTKKYLELCHNDSGDLTSISNDLMFLPVRILTSDGFLYTFLFDPKKGGECLLLSQLYLPAE